MDMRETLEEIMNNRLNTAFCSEADFQFTLAWEIKEVLGKGYEVMLEYPEQKKDEKDQKDKTKTVYYDICVAKDKGKKTEESYLIELKYRTKEDTITRHGHDFSLKNQGAQNLGRVHFIQDIARLEKQNVVNGKCYCIMLTNDDAYSKESKRKKTKDKEFRLHKEISAGTKRYGDDSNGTVKIENTYPVEWKDYKLTKENPKQQYPFQYLLLEIPPAGKDGGDQSEFADKRPESNRR